MQMLTPDNRKETVATQNRYDRIASLYNIMEIAPELLYKRWRKHIWSEVTAGDILEIGVGTGKNVPYYAPDINITAIDLSPKMLMWARKETKALDKDVGLSQMDAQLLGLKSDSFDTVIATFAFCSISDPILGLAEIKRVLKPDGRVILLEHMRSKYEGLGKLMDVFDPFVHRFTGPHINRRTVENVRTAGLMTQQVKELDPFGIFRMIRARK
jgi:ubiquinone/menaquinone biosynthesis C-methylase UbiE